MNRRSTTLSTRRATKRNTHRKHSRWALPVFAILLAAGIGRADPVPARNRIVNGSFDAGPIGWWAKLPDLGSRVETGEDDGRRFLIAHSAMARGRPTLVFSSWFAAGRAERDIAVSFRARGDGRGSVAIGCVSPSSSLHGLGDREPIELTGDWREFRFRLPLPPAQGGLYQLVFDTTSRLDLDAVEAGRAAEVPGFQPAAPVEAGLECAEPTRIFFTTETPRFAVHVSDAASASRESPLPFRYRLTDYFDRPAGGNACARPAGASTRTAFTLPVPSPGYYRIHWSLGDEAQGVDAFIVTQAPDARPDPRFSITMGDSNFRLSARQIRRLGAGGIRLHGYFTYHDMPRSENGVFGANETDILDFLRSETGAPLLAMLTGTRPEFLDEAGRFLIPPALEAMDRILEATAPFVEAYEIMNEPNQAFPGSPDDYARYLAAAYDRIQETHPDKKVVGICPSNILLTYIDRVLRAGSADKMDVLSFHPYGLTSPDAREIGTELRKLHEIVDRRFQGPAPALWATEIGYRGSDRPMDKPQRYPGIRLFSEAEVARFMVKMNLMLLDHGVERMYWFHLPGVGGLPNPFYFGFTYENPEPAIPKKMAAAFSQMARSLSGLPMTGRADTGDDDTYLYRFAPASEDASPSRWALFKDERAEGVHRLFFRSRAPVTYERIDGSRAAANRLDDALWMIEVAADPGYLFEAEPGGLEWIRPVAIDGLPEEVWDGDVVDIRLVSSNPFGRPIETTVRPLLPGGWRTEPAVLSLSLAPGERRVEPMTLFIPAGGGDAAFRPVLRFAFDMHDGVDGPTTLSRRIRMRLHKYRDLQPLTIPAASLEWTTRSAGDNWTVAPRDGGVEATYVFSNAKKHTWGAVETRFEPPRDLGGFRTVRFEVKCSDPSAFTPSLVLVDPSGALYRATIDVDVAMKDRWQAAAADLDAVTPIGSSGIRDDNGALDLDQVRGVGVLGVSHREIKGVFELRSLTFEP
jgi:hypothetical protein